MYDVYVSIIVRLLRAGSRYCVNGEETKGQGVIDPSLCKVGISLSAWHQWCQQSKELPITN